jgi:Prokaryotic homologs of the JAB domain
VATAQTIRRSGGACCHPRCIRFAYADEREKTRLAYAGQGGRARARPASGHHIQVSIGEYARQTIDDELRHSAAELRDGCETGGWLWAEQGAAWWRTEGLTITFASGPGDKAIRAPGALTLDTDSLFAADEVFRREGYELIGQWHTHPGGDDQPSDTDDLRIKALLSFREEWGCRTPRALELILTPSGTGWEIHPWVLYRTKKAKPGAPAGRVRPAEPAVIRGLA